MKHITKICSFLLLCILLSACRQSGFDGSIVKNESEFTITFQSFNTTESHSFELSEGDAIRAEIECEKGALSVTVQKDGDEPIYSGSDPLSDGFEVEIREGGTYTITVTGEKAKGSAAFSVIAESGVDLTGLWQLDGENNDLTAFQDSFPAYMEFGAGMEIKSDGQISWYIGIEGGSGTYSQDGDTLTADILTDVGQEQIAVPLHIIADGEAVQLEMMYNGATVYWIPGDSGEALK